MGTAIGKLAGCNFRDTVSAADRSDQKKGTIGAGCVNLRRKKTRKHMKMGHEKEWFTFGDQMSFWWLFWWLKSFIFTFTILVHSLVDDYFWKGYNPNMYMCMNGCKRLQSQYVHVNSLSGKNLANNGHSSYKCGSLAEPPEASAAGNFFWGGASALKSDFAWILSGFKLLSQLDKR